MRVGINPKWLQRLRHRKGFGIHSPFAFRFITEVLNPGDKVGFYAYEDIRKLDNVLSFHFKRSDCFVLFRVLNYFHPADIIIVSNDKDRLQALQQLVKIARPTATVSSRTVGEKRSGNDVFYIIDAFNASDNDICGDTLAEAAKSASSAYIFCRSSLRSNLKKAFATLPYGMTFTSGWKNGCCVIAAIDYLPRQDFLVRF